MELGTWEEEWKINMNEKYYNVPEKYLQVTISKEIYSYLAQASLHWEPLVVLLPWWWKQIH